MHNMQRKKMKKNYFLKRCISVETPTKLKFVSLKYGGVNKRESVILENK